MAGSVSYGLGIDSPLTLDAPPIVAVYLRYYVLGEAYGKEGEMEMPDLAAHARGMVSMLEDLCRTYYGRSA